MVVKNILYASAVYCFCFVVNFIVCRLNIADMAHIDLEVDILRTVSIVISILLHYICYCRKKYRKNYKTKDIVMLIIMFIIGIILSQLALVSAMFVNFAIVMKDF